MLCIQNLPTYIKTTLGLNLFRRRESYFFIECLTRLHQSTEFDTQGSIWFRQTVPALNSRLSHASRPNGMISCSETLLKNNTLVSKKFKFYIRHMALETRLPAVCQTLVRPFLMNVLVLISLFWICYIISFLILFCFRRMGLSVWQISLGSHPEICTCLCLTTAKTEVMGYHALQLLPTSFTPSVSSCF